MIMNQEQDIGDDDNFLEEINPNTIDPLELNFFETSHGNRGIIAREKMYKPLKYNIVYYVV